MASFDELMLAAYIAGANDANAGVKCNRSSFEGWISRDGVKKGFSRAKYPPACKACRDKGVIETGNNDLPCDCTAGDNAMFNTERGTETGAQIKARRR